MWNVDKLAWGNPLARVTEGVMGTLPGMNGGLLNCRNNMCQANIGFTCLFAHEIARSAHPHQRPHQCAGRGGFWASSVEIPVCSTSNRLHIDDIFLVFLVNWGSSITSSAMTRSFPEVFNFNFNGLFLKLHRCICN